MEESKETKKRIRINLARKDWLYILALVIFIAILTYPNYVNKGNCEVARPGFKCESVRNVMIENCNYWSTYTCDTSKDVSLVQIEWYIGKLCDLQKQKDPSLDCSNLKTACNQITQTNTCPV